MVSYDVWSAFPGAAQFHTKRRLEETKTLTFLSDREEKKVWGGGRSVEKITRLPDIHNDCNYDEVDSGQRGDIITCPNCCSTVIQEAFWPSGHLSVERLKDLFILTETNLPLYPVLFKHRKMRKRQKSNNYIKVCVLFKWFWRMGRMMGVVYPVIPPSNQLLLLV